VSEPVRKRFWFQALAGPLRDFFHDEAAGGVLLLLATVAALALANTGASELFAAFVDGSVPLPGREVPVHALVNDGLMTLFFLVVGLEIKRELVDGELSSVRSAILPAIGALGGMLVPAAIYVLFNGGGAGARGWAIPMATDIAFSIGCLALLKDRVPSGLVVFLTALAIFDDIGGIVMIALFYGHGFAPLWLLAAGALAAAVVWLGRRGIHGTASILAAGALLWFFFHQSGIHATMAGVLLGVVVPVRAANGEEPAERLIKLLHPLVAFAIVPLFALVNAGVSLRGLAPADLLAPVCLGSALGLFLGKQIGVFLFSWGAVRLGVASMPGNGTLSQLHGVALIAGIGFTVALFIATLAFDGDPDLLRQAKLGILCGSAAAGIAGMAVLRFAGRAPAAA
jgi:NhaA family Na+:H+ antiporter